MDLNGRSYTAGTGVREAPEAESESRTLRNRFLGDQYVRRCQMFLGPVCDLECVGACVMLLTPFFLSGAFRGAIHADTCIHYLYLEG